MESMNIDNLRQQLDHLNNEMASFTDHPAISLTKQSGTAERDALFLYGIVGGKDVGKTSIINLLVGETVSHDSNILDEGTKVAVAYCHTDDMAAAKQRLALHNDARVRYVSHSSPLLKNVVLMDLPDFDSRFQAHVDDVHVLSKHFEYFIWITTPRKYGDFELMEQLAGIAQSHSNYLFVLNKTDQLHPQVALETIREELIDFVSSECRARDLSQPEPSQFFIISALNPQDFEFQAFRDRLIRSHSMAEIKSAKGSNLKAEFDKNVARIRKEYKLSTLIETLEQVLVEVREQISQTFPEKYFNTVQRRLAGLNSLNQRITQMLFTKKVSEWPVLRWLFFPFVGLISILGGRLTSQKVDASPPDTTRELLRYEGIPASLRLQKIYDQIHNAYPEVRQYLPESSDYSALVSDEFSSLMAEYEDRVTDELATAHRHPGILKKMLMCFPLIWIPFLQPFLFHLTSQPNPETAIFSLPVLITGLVSILGAKSLFMSLMFLLLFYMVLLVILFARCASLVKRTGTDEFKNLWYGRFLKRLQDELEQPVHKSRAILSGYETSLKHIEDTVLAEIEAIQHD